MSIFFNLCIFSALSLAAVAMAPGDARTDLAKTTLMRKEFAGDLGAEALIEENGESQEDRISARYFGGHNHNLLSTGHEEDAISARHSGGHNHDLLGTGHEGGAAFNRSFLDVGDEELEADDRMKQEQAQGSVWPWDQRRRRRYIAPCDSRWSACVPLGGNECSPGQMTRSCSPRFKECQPVCVPKSCVWASWSSWSTCTKSCASGTQERTRSKTRDENCCGSCSTKTKETKPCNTHKCPIDCVIGEWQAWGQCNATCGTAVSVRVRVPKVVSTYGGKNCTESLNETKSCNVTPCMDLAPNTTNTTTTTTASAPASCSFSHILILLVALAWSWALHGA